MARIFKPEPNVTINETKVTEGKTIDEVKKILAALGHPQVLTSTVQETTKGEDTIYSFLPAAGKKG